MTVTRRYLAGKPVRREDFEMRPVESEQIARIVENVRQRAKR